ncbi:LacI family DNA-binding transcriptional regulator [Domibacillus sp. A3M-37]|uniref:LacI family DNA-binding transcriptional regulator n=1 Tax=Domibacillus sp. A3M-37 TaxID=2962037 RepID=UPI0020B65F22|nr:LacI family DNA-binding transcriptional regulator [Domibacillus sp. A3M-37]MCP3763704.1 LacI family DNA-binding transcriptional regulator [Domibacillus sp. A3M-37]
MKINDIAKLANVSKSAVSLALNGKNGVSEKTRQKVLQIAKENGYVPRPIVRADEISGQNTKAFRFIACTNEGIVTEQYESLPFFMELINSLDRHTDAAGYSLMVSSVKAENLFEEINRLEDEQKSAGILLLGTNLTAEQIKLVANIHPNLVVLDTCYGMLDVNFVVMNNMHGAYKAGEYLIEQGHTRIGYCSSESRMYNFDMRKKGFFTAMDEHQISVADEHIFVMSPTLIQSTPEFQTQIQELKENLPTALFCECDYMAISVIKSLTELGLRVPHDISVIGFDNILESQVITPELTTIHVKKDRIALLAVEKLLREINQFETDKLKIFVDTELIERKSCQPFNQEVIENNPKLVL